MRTPELEKRRMRGAQSSLQLPEEGTWTGKCWSVLPGSHWQDTWGWFPAHQGVCTGQWEVFSEKAVNPRTGCPFHLSSSKTLSMLLSPEISIFYLLCHSLEPLRPSSVPLCPEWQGQILCFYTPKHSVSSPLKLCLHLNLLNPSFPMILPSAWRPLSFPSFVFSVCKNSLGGSCCKCFVAKTTSFLKKCNTIFKKYISLLPVLFLSDQLTNKLSGSSSLKQLSNKAKVIQGSKVRNEKLQIDKILCK